MTRSPKELPLPERRRFWRVHVEAWRQGSLSQAEYCRQERLPLASFVYWKSKFGKTETASRQPSLVPVPVQLTSVRSSCTPPLRLCVDDRFRIEIGGNFSPAVLEKLIQTLTHLP